MIMMKEPKMLMIVMQQLALWRLPGWTPGNLPEMVKMAAVP